MVVITGPRGVGKTTTASRFARTEISLLNPTLADSFRIDPYEALEGLDEPVLIDEWQYVPEVIAAVKQSIDQDTRPNRFLLTGSVNAHINGALVNLTRRGYSVDMFPLTVSELRQNFTRPLFDRIIEGEDIRHLSYGKLSLGDYLDLAVRGGFPLAQQIEQSKLAGYHRSSIQQQLQNQDLSQVSDTLPDPEVLWKYFQVYADLTATLADDLTINQALKISRPTGKVYHSILKRLLLIHEVPAWRSSLLTRVRKQSKRFVVDPSLYTAALNRSRDDIRLDGSVIGKLMETFVAAQIRAELPMSKYNPELFHLRDESKREVDLLLDTSKGVIGIEIKSAHTPPRQDANHLFWLQEKLGKKFLAGIVFHTGWIPYKYSDQIWGLPISYLWATEPDETEQTNPCENIDTASSIEPHIGL